ncbi:MAG TPA: DUF2079 domain-containing protein [bacterium]|nr:DUF2079 domain-containing protein [bacterium]
MSSKIFKTKIIFFIIVFGIFINFCFFFYQYKNYLIYDTDGATIFSQLYNIIYQGKFYLSYLDINSLREHFSWVKLITAPAFIITNWQLSPYLILLFLLVFSVFFLYKYCSLIFKNFTTPMLIVFIYLLNPYFRNILFTADEGTYAVFLIFLYFVSLKQNNKKIMIISLILFCLAKETNFVFAGILVLYSMLFTKHKKIAAFLLFFVCVGFLIITFIIMPSLGHQCDKYFLIYSEILKNPQMQLHQSNFFEKLISEKKIFFLIELLIPTAFIILLDFKKFIIILFFYFILTITGKDAAFNINFYYFSVCLPIIFLAFVAALAKIKNFKALNTFLFFVFIFNLAINGYYKFYKTDHSKKFNTENNQELKKILLLISEKQSVFTTTRFHFYISFREIVRMPHIENIQEDIILLDFSENEWFLMAPVKNKKILELYLMKKILWLIETNQYYIKYLSDNFLILEKTEKVSAAESIEKLKKLFERRMYNIIPENFKDKLLPIYLPENENYLAFDIKQNKIINAPLLTQYTFLPTAKISKIKFSNTNQEYIAENINKYYISLNDIRIPQNILLYGINILKCSVLFDDSSTQSIDIPILFDNQPPQIKLDKNILVYNDDYSVVEIIAIDKKAREKYLTSCMINKNSIFIDKIYNKVADMSYDLFLHNKLTTSGKIKIKSRANYKKILVRDFAGNEIILDFTQHN